MRKYSANQRKVITDFLTTIAAGWFGAGVITTVFMRPILLSDAVLNIFIGAALAYFSLRFALYLAKR